MFELFVANDLVQRRGRDRHKAALVPARADVRPAERSARKAEALRHLAARRRVAASPGC